MLATAGPASAARADGCNNGCGYGGYGGYTGYNGCNTGCGFAGFAGYTGYNGCNTGCGYAGYAGAAGAAAPTGAAPPTGQQLPHAPEYPGMPPVRAGLQPFLEEGSSVTLGVSPTTGPVGTKFTWTANVTCGVYNDVTDTVTAETVTDGTATFDVYGQGYYIDQAVPVTNGVATLTLTPPRAGFYTGEAMYNGDGIGPCGASPWSNTAPITVTRAAQAPPVINIVNQFHFHFGHAHMRGKHKHMYAPAAPAAVPVTG